MTDAELDALDRLCQQATPEPWTVGMYGYEILSSEGAVVDSGYDDGGVFKDADAAFIATSRTALPQLVAEVRRLQELVGMAWWEGFSDGCADERAFGPSATFEGSDAYRSLHKP